MKQRVHLALLGLALGLVAQWGCAVSSPATSWGWSSWYRRFGTGGMGTFATQRNTCLHQMGITDPERVEVRSSEDVGFVHCMNAAGWCSQVWECDAPSVRE